MYIYIYVQTISKLGNFSVSLKLSYCIKSKLCGGLHPGESEPPLHYVARHTNYLEVRPLLSPLYALYGPLHARRRGPRGSMGV